MKFDKVYLSVLDRAIETYHEMSEDNELSELPVEKSWRLNERHYGALTGLNKKETAEKYGKDQVHIWRRSYDIPPPKMEEDDPRLPCFNPLYKDIEP